MDSGLNFIVPLRSLVNGKRYGWKGGSSSPSVTALLVWSSCTFLIFQVETRAKEEEGVTSFQRLYELCLWHV